MAPAASGKGATVICVLGMSRSGTSLTTRLLNLSGVDLGPGGRLLKPMPSNPEGFWEHFDIMRLNELILRSLGGSWRAPPPLPPGWETSEALEPQRTYARELLEGFEGQALWGWKDPRNCLTLPFWQRLVPAMRYVICLRNPIDVAASLERRDGIPRREGLELWLTYVASALVNSSGRQRLLVSYEEYFDDWRAAVKRLVRFVGVSAGDGCSAAVELAQQTIKSELRHHRTPRAEVSRDPAVPADVASLYLIAQLLRTATSSPDQAIGLDQMQRAVDEHAARLLAVRGLSVEQPAV